MSFFKKLFKVAKWDPALAPIANDPIVDDAVLGGDRAKEAAAQEEAVRAAASAADRRAMGNAKAAAYAQRMKEEQAAEVARLDAEKAAAAAEKARRMEIYRQQNEAELAAQPGEPTAPTTPGIPGDTAPDYSLPPAFGSLDGPVGRGANSGKSLRAMMAARSAPTALNK